MNDRLWLASYPPGVPADIDVGRYASLPALMEESFSTHADRIAYSFMGRDATYGEVDRLSRASAAYLQGLGLNPGDAIAGPSCPRRDTMGLTVGGSALAHGPSCDA